MINGDRNKSPFHFGNFMFGHGSNWFGNKIGPGSFFRLMMSRNRKRKKSTKSIYDNITGNSQFG
ncbi:MAG: hypothetical protein ACTSRT_03295 [Promethearchaeota archaeon]